MNDYLQKAMVLRGQIKEILLNQWDPIGIQDMPEAQDEYDAYVAGIYKLDFLQKSIVYDKCRNRKKKIWLKIQP